MENLLHIGDLVMCKVRIDPNCGDDYNNIKLVIGWITGKELNGYYVHWSDKDYAHLINSTSAILTRNLFLEQRKAMGI
jgi:hypothetical protein